MTAHQDNDRVEATEVCRERELLAAKLEAELFANVNEGATEHDCGYRAGWNARAKATIAQLRGGR